MDRSLWLLLWLRLRGFARRQRAQLRTAKGILLALAGAMFLVPCIGSWILSLFLIQAQPADARSLEEIRRLGPLGLIALALVSLFTSASERAVIAFAPAEVDLLFPAPFSRRQLLAYKLFLNFLFSIPVSLFLVLGTSALRLAGIPLLHRLVGVVLAVACVQFFTIVLGLLAQHVGIRAYTRGRRFALAILVAVVFVGLLSQGASPSGNLREWALRLESSPVTQALLTPLRWFVLAYTAERFFPDFVSYGSLGLLVDVFLIALIFRLDANYLETAALASERLYAQLERFRRGGASATILPGAGKSRLRLPMLPWWGGAGPIAWRQLTAAPRSRGCLALVLMLVPVIAIPVVSSWKPHPDQHVLPVAIGAIASQVFVMTFFMTPLIAFDFRGDVDRMEVLKSLPVPASGLVVGQLITPVCILSLLQWLALVLVAVTARTESAAQAAVLAVPFIPLFNAILIAVDNWLFLLFPARIAGGGLGDVGQMLGRQVVFTLAKSFALGVAAGIAAAVAVPLYFVTGNQLWLALAVAWLVLAGCVGAWVPLLALAFRQFDVARDTPA